jgi:GMP synthase (glutamine-hydrolysing)
MSSDNGRVLVIQNDPDKTLGRLGDALIRGGVELDMHFPDRDLPPLPGYDGLVVLPGLADPVDETEAVERARRAIDDALDADLPVLGLCLGGQLLAQALGGSVYRSPPELGFGEVSASAAASGDPLLAAAPSRFSVFHAHVFSFEPPPGAEILLTNDLCVQACRFGEAWAFQCHPEVSHDWALALAAGLRGRDVDVRARTIDFFHRNGVAPEDLERDARAAEPALRKVGESIGAGFALRVTGVVRSAS